MTVPSATYDVVLLIEQPLSVQDAKQVRGLHEEVEDPVRYHVLLPVEDAAARVESAMGSLAGGEMLATPMPALDPADVQEVQRDLLDKARDDVAKCVKRILAAGGDATGEVVSAADLGGPRAQMNKSGVAHFLADNDVEAAAICRRLLSFLPSNNLEDPPRANPDEGNLYNPELNEAVPDEAKAGYEVRDVITRIVDYADFLEVRSEFARNIVVGFGRVRGRTVGLVANQPSVLAGVLDIDASDKAASFVRFCNAFNIPLITLVDVPTCRYGPRVSATPPTACASPRLARNASVRTAKVFSSAGGLALGIDPFQCRLGLFLESQHGPVASSRSRQGADGRERSGVRRSSLDLPTRLLEDLSRTFAEGGINILEATCTTKHPMVKNRFVVEVGDTDQLKQCVARLRNLESVFDAYRVTPTA